MTYDYHILTSGFNRKRNRKEIKIKNKNKNKNKIKSTVYNSDRTVNSNL